MHINMILSKVNMQQCGSVLLLLQGNNGIMVSKNWCVLIKKLWFDTCSYDVF